MRKNQYFGCPRQFVICQREIWLLQFTTTIWKNCYEQKKKQLTGKTLAGKQKKMIEIDNVVVDESCGKRRGKRRGSKNAFFLKNCCRAIRFQSISNRNTQMYSKYVAPITTYFLYLELTICTKKEALQPINFLRQNSYFFFLEKKTLLLYGNRYIFLKRKIRRCTT